MLTLSQGRNHGGQFSKVPSGSAYCRVERCLSVYHAGARGRRDGEARALSLDPEGLAEKWIGRRGKSPGQGEGEPEVTGPGSGLEVNGVAVWKGIGRSNIVSKLVTEV